jgi:zinc protease
VIDLPQAAQAMVYAGVRTTNRAGADYYPLDIANSVLGLSSTSRLNTEVRMKRGLSYSARSSMPARAGEAVLSATVQTQNATVDEVVQIVLDQFAALGTQPADEAALQLRRAFLVGAVGRALETSGGFNAVVTGLLMQGQEAAEATRAAERWAAVTPEAAAAVARRYITPERASLIVVGKAADFVEDLRKIRPDLVVIPAATLDLSSAALGN